MTQASFHADHGTAERRSPAPPAAIWGYGVAVVSVSIALGAALLLGMFSVHDVGYPLLLSAIAVTVWYAGLGPAVLALVLAATGFNYFFTQPYHSLYIKSSDLPHYTAFVLFAWLVAWFSSARRRIEQDLRNSRIELEREVTERTQQASLLDLTHDTIFVRDMGDTITYWNLGARELYGWTAPEAIGKNAHEFLQTDSPQPVEEIRRELLRTGRWEGELRKTTADGTHVMVASRWSLRRDAQGRPAVILETNNDITQRNRREQEIRMLNEELSKRSIELQAINQELEAFAYSVSHDLRAPVRHIVGFTELLLKGAGPVLNERSRRHAAMILESAQRMGHLIDDLLDFSRIGRAETHKTMVSLRQLVQEALSEVTRETEGRSIEWSIGALPLLYADRAMLRVALVNLISNAVKFTSTRATARIEIASTQQGSNQAVIFIRDNGVGFDMKYVGKLFGVFQRLHAPEEFEGTGIGLATVQRIVHRHGGQVWAEGAVGQGATFYLSLSKSQQV
jgi:PAS domain S-box-containing protein